MEKFTSLKTVLQDDEGRAIIDGIEDTLGSLRGQETNPMLLNILSRQIKDLENKTGYRYETDLV